MTVTHSKKAHMVSNLLPVSLAALRLDPNYYYVDGLSEAIESPLDVTCG